MRQKIISDRSLVAKGRAQAQEVGAMLLKFSLPNFFIMTDFILHINIFRSKSTIFGL